MSNKAKIEVFHDGDCPVCRWEIAFYSKLDHGKKVRWTDIISLSEEAIPVGKTRSDLLGKFHVRELTSDRDQDWYIGVEAFSRIWKELPVFNWFAWVFAVPGIKQLAELAYRGFLRWQSKDRAKREINRDENRSFP